MEKIKKRSIKIAQSATPSTPAPATTEADASSSKAVDSANHPVEVFLVEPIWTKPFLAYMLRQELPEDTVEARRITRRTKVFMIIKGELYKRSISGILQRCIAVEDGKAMLLEIHASTCGHQDRKSTRLNSSHPV